MSELSNNSRQLQQQQTNTSEIVADFQLRYKIQYEGLAVMLTQELIDQWKKVQINICRESCSAVTGADMYSTAPLSEWVIFHS